MKAALLSPVSPEAITRKRGGVAATYLFHAQEIAGAIPALATNTMRSTCQKMSSKARSFHTEHQ